MRLVRCNSAVPGRTTKWGAAEVTKPNERIQRTSRATLPVWDSAVAARSAADPGRLAAGNPTWQPSMKMRSAIPLYQLAGIIRSSQMLPFVVN